MMQDEASAAQPAAALALLRALQFGDSMFPVGSFAFSNGLESAVQERVVTDRATLLAFARTAVVQADAGDGVAVVHAHRAAAAGDVEAVAAIDRLVFARKLSSETRTMSVRTGRKFAEMGARVVGTPPLHDWLARIEAGTTPGTYPVALAVNFAAQGLPAQSAFVVHRYGVAATVLGAALRLMRIGHVDTQQLLYELGSDADVAFARAEAAPLAAMAGFAPMAEILAAVHVRAHVRMFMN